MPACQLRSQSDPEEVAEDLHLSSSDVRPAMCLPDKTAEVLNPAAVIQDLEASEEYEYARLFRVLLEIQRTGDPDSSCLRDFLAERALHRTIHACLPCPRLRKAPRFLCFRAKENCEVTDLVLDALPFLQKARPWAWLGLGLGISAPCRELTTFRPSVDTAG